MRGEKALNFPISSTEILEDEDDLASLHKLRLELVQAINRSHTNKVPFDENGLKAVATYNKWARHYGEEEIPYTPPELEEPEPPAKVFLLKRLAYAIRKIRGHPQ